DYTIKFYLENGADPDKLVLGIPTYGRSYTLFNADAICEALKPKEKKKRSLSSDEDLEEYSEEEEVEEEWTIMHPNPKAMGPVAYKGNQWVGYDDVDIVKKKAEYVADNGLGGHIPPKKRRNNKSIYIATIEKGLALVRSLIELNRLDEIGLIVVDELHLIGEKGRGGTLEILLTTVLFANRMSATIGNLSELGQFLRASLFARQFRPVPLTERVKLGDMLHRIRWGDTVEIVPDTQLANDYSESAKRLDPDGLAALVWTGKVPSSCLVFCPTKKNCENSVPERVELERALRGEGAAPELWRGVRHGVAFHHAGLAPDERAAVEHAFRSGVLTVLCCTSTLAAGVNLPAARVVLRAPYVGRDLISLAAYRQMAGRAGRAGVCQAGESVIICSARDWPRLRDVFARGLSPARSVLCGAPGGAALLLSGVALGLATDRVQLHALMSCTLLAVPHADDDSSPVDIKAVCDSALHALLKVGALEARAEPDSAPDAHASRVSAVGRIIYNDTQLTYCNLDEEGIQTAKILGITEMNAIRMVTGKPITMILIEKVENLRAEAEDVMEQLIP
ncbi:Uncharacterized protein OBRU01_21795, partial [Operophtera brumata]